MLVLAVLAQLATVGMGAAVAQAEPVRAEVSERVPAACLPGFGYLLSGGDGSVQQVNLSTGVRAAIGTFTGIAPNLNAMDISPGGLSAWASSPPAAAGGTQNIYKLDLTTNTTQAFTGAVQPAGVGPILRGAINPVNGWYYYSGGLSSSTSQGVYAFDTVNNVSIGLVGTLTNPAFNGGSGDIVFDSAGRLYILISNGVTNVLVRVNQTLPTTAANIPLTASLLANLPPSASGAAYGGVLFGADGYLYVTVNEGPAGLLSKIDPNTGALVSSVSMSVPAGTPSGVADAGNCSFTGSLTAQKNIVGRVNPGDQFQVSVTGNGIGSGNIGTTTGTDTGLQTAVGETTTVPGVVGEVYTFTETGVGGTDLAGYTTTYACVDTAHNNAPIASGSGTSVQVTQPASPDANGVQTTCTFTNTPGAPVDLALTKTATPAVYTPGQPLTYTITVTNNGPNASTGYTVTDTLPAALVNPSTTTPGCTITAGVLNCTGAALANGANTTITVTGTAGPGTADITNTATVTGDDPDPDPGNNTDTNITPPASVDLAVDKTGPATVTAGGNVSYTITVTNNGPSDSTGWTLTDPIPAGLNGAATTTAGCTVAGGTLTCDGGPLANGASFPITLTGTAAPNATTIVNTATVDGDDPDPNPDNNTDTFTTTVGRSADLAVDKTGPASVTAGGNVSYTITVTNNGPSDSTGWTLTDPIPAGLNGAATTTAGCTVAGGNLTCDGGPLANGDSFAITLTGTAAGGTTSTIVNTATVDGDDPDPNPDNNTDTFTTTIGRSADLAVDKTGPASVTAGGNISYTITVTNNGPSDSTGWTLTDPIPAGLNGAATTTAGCTVAGGTLTCDGGPLANGGSFPITLTGTAAPNATTIVNTATVDGDDPDPNPDNDTDTFTTTVGRSVDLAVDKTGPATVTAGGNISYTITVTNNGPSDSTGWTLTDPIPAGLNGAATTTAGCTVAGGTLTCDGGPLANGASFPITLTGTAAPNATTIVNTATVDGDDPDPNPDNNTDTFTTTVGRSADLAVDKTGPASVTAGGNISYTITVTNNGPSDSTGYTISDPIPAGLNGVATTTPGCTVTAGELTCTGGPLANGASRTITLTGTAAPNATAITNKVTVTGNDPDPDPRNNTSTKITNITTSADLAVVKTGPSSVDAGGSVSYTITVTNNGPSDSTGYTISDPIPAGLNGAATTTPGCTVTAGELTCTGGPLANGASRTITLTGTAAPNATTITNKVTVTGNDPDPDPRNNTSTKITNITTSADLAVVKTGPDTVAPGGQITYTITITNNGPGDSTGYTLTDTIPAQVGGAATTTPGCGIGAGVLTCAGGPLANGDSDTVTVTGTAAPGATVIENTAKVTGEDPDPDPRNNTSTKITNVTGTPGLTITKKQNGPATVRAGAEAGYTITVRNTGTTTYTQADPATFTDDLSELLDDAVYNDDASATRGTVSYSEPVLEWSGALTPGQTATITFSVTTNARPFGDLRLLNTVVSDTPGSNCPARTAEAAIDPRCTTKGKVDIKDKDKDKGGKGKDRPRATRPS